MNFEVSFSSAVDASRTRQQLVLASLAIVNLCVLPVSVYVYINPRPVFVGQYMYGLLFVATFDILVMVYILGEETSADCRFFTEGSPLFRWQILISLALIGFSSLVLLGLTPVFFITMSVIFLLLLGRIITETGTRGSTMILLLGISLFLFLSILRIDGFPVGVNDDLIKGAYVEAIISTGDLGTLEPTRYRNLPIYFSLSFVMIQVVDLSSRITAVVMGSFLYSSVLSTIYCITRTLVSSSKAGLVAGVLVATNPLILQYSNSPRPQSLSFVYLSVFLFLLLLDTDARWMRTTVLFVITTVAWVGTHHLSVMVVLPPVLAYLAYDIYIGTARNEWSIVNATGMKVLIWGCLVSLHWVIVTRTIMTPIRWVFRVSPGAKGRDIAPSVTGGDTPIQLLTDALPFFIQNADYALLLGLTGVGVLLIFTGLVNFSGRFRALCGLAFSGIVYFPSPLWLPIGPYFPFRRSGLVMLPFIIPIAAVALVHIFRQSRSEVGWPVKQFTVTTIVFLLLFTSMLSGWAEPSVNDVAGYDKEARNYISDEDLQTIQFIRTYGIEETSIYGPFLIQQYLSQSTGRMEELERSNGQFWRIDTVDIMTVDRETGLVLYESGLTVYPKITLKQDSAKAQTVQAQTLLMSEDDTIWNTSVRNVIYNDGNSEVVYTE